MEKSCSESVARYVICQMFFNFNRRYLSFNAVTRCPCALLGGGHLKCDILNSSQNLLNIYRLTIRDTSL